VPSPKNRRKIVQGVAVVLFLSILMSWSTNNAEKLLFFEKVLAKALYPFHYAVNAVTMFGVNTWDYIVDISNVYNDNKKLQDLVDKYIGIDLRLIEIQQENLRLRDLLNFKESVEFEVTPAQVIGRNPSNWFSTITIDKGSKHGIKVDMPVVTNQGLVGKIIEVQPSYAKVQLLISPDSGISSIVQRTRDNGVLIGLSSPSGYTMITRLHQKADLKEGDIIISSPLTGIYPKGLTIGRVVEVYDDAISLERRALVKPEVDFDRLEEVLIIVNYEPAKDAGGIALDGVEDGDLE